MRTRATSRKTTAALAALTVAAFAACGGTVRRDGIDGGSDDDTGGTTSSTGGTTSSTGGKANTGGGAGRTALWAADYDRSCTAAPLGNDCRVVSQGEQCCMHCADFAAISSSAPWDADVAAVACPLGIRMPCGNATPHGCVAKEPSAICVNGQCELWQPADVDLNDYDRSCLADAECVAVSPGDSCGCQCGGSTLSQTGYDKYIKDVIPCPGQPAICRCPAFHAPICKFSNDAGMGTCTIPDFLEPHG